jgi:hypothetical protein
MIRLLTYTLIMVIPIVTTAQKKTTKLQPLASADIIYEAAEATISFNKKDFLAAYEQYKKDKADELEMQAVAANDRLIKKISTSKSKTIVVTGPNATFEQQMLEDIIKSEVGAALLMAGKADVIRKKNSAHEKEIVFGPLIENSDDDTYLFFFTDQTEFFRGSH